MERFIVGTGRCGSTLLARMVGCHVDVVPIHEFFTGLDWSRRFSSEPTAGPELATLVAAHQPVTTEVLARGYQTDEIQYPFDDPAARYRRGDPVPWLLVTMLSRLTDRPDGWYDELVEFAERRPVSTMAEHYRALFGWVAARAGGSIWIERSGSSLDYLADLVSMYPDARFVHIHRDGHEAALSIRAHPFFRLGVALLMDLFPEGDETAAVDRVIETPPPCWAVGRYWSDQVVRGFRAMPALRPEQLLQVRFEDLLHHPASVVATVAEFFRLPPDKGFLDRSCSLVSAAPASRYDRLPGDEQVELAAVCRPGQMLLGRAD